MLAFLLFQVCRHGCLDDSYLILSNSTLGSANGCVSSAVAISGDSVDIEHSLSVYSGDSGYDLYLGSDGKIIWSVASGGSVGNVDLESSFYVNEAGVPDWKATFAGQYGGDMFHVVMSDYPYSGSPELIFVEGSGVYGGNAEHW